MKKQSIWVFQWRKSVHYWWSYILFSPECKELTSMLDPLLYRWGVPLVVIRCVHWTMQMWVLQTWIKALGLYIVMKLFLLICLFVYLFIARNRSGSWQWAIMRIIAQEVCRPSLARWCYLMMLLIGPKPVPLCHMAFSIVLTNCVNST